MITIKNVRSLLGEIETLIIPSEKTKTIDAEGEWTLFPAAIDVGANTLSNENALAHKAVEGGVTTVFCRYSFLQSITRDEVQYQKDRANSEVSIDKIPLTTHAYFELGPDTIENLGQFKSQMAAILIPNNNHFDTQLMERIFQLAAAEDCIVAFVCDSKVPEKTYQAIELTEKYSNQLLLLNISNTQEINYLRDAKKSELLVYSAASVSALQSEDVLWEAIYDKTLDLVASGFSKVESDLILPTLLDGYNDKKITYEGVVALTRTNAENIFQLGYSRDITLVNSNKIKTASTGKELKGWPCCTILKGHVFGLL